MSTRRAAPLIHGAIVAATCAASMIANANLSEPPRYDGAGYAVLAKSILAGRGYREIDKPGAPRHAHFPPGYSMALAALWSVTGISFRAAHAFSFACTVGAAVLAWVWFRSWARPGVALLMGLALAVNWRWARDGTAIRSEPLFLLLGQAAVLVADWVARRGGAWRSAALGGLLGAVILTRHVGLALAAALCVALWWRGRRREVFFALCATAIVVARWFAWLVEVPGNTQVELIPVRSLESTILGNALFYLRRLIDQIVGPLIEVATVFAGRFTSDETLIWATSMMATLVAALACVPIAWGWVRVGRRRRSRAAGLVPGFTLAMLLAWPFTEAGRFLVPLVPFLIAGLAEGSAVITARWGIRRARLLAAGIVLAISIPYSLYAVASRRAEADRATHRDFDAACDWIASQSGSPGLILSRHPGEVYLRTGRIGLDPSDLQAQEPSDLGFVLEDGGRFRDPFPRQEEYRVRYLSERFPVAKRWGNVVVYRAKPD